mmetsp:Transcript_71796/g.115928  ORF Transcript_71796/g.115928 Transcript_71796/m.115928 type:complete len:225 (+) Transcript_71796:299-973(+)
MSKAVIHMAASFCVTHPDCGRSFLCLSNVSGRLQTPSTSCRIMYCCPLLSRIAQNWLLPAPKLNRIWSPPTGCKVAWSSKVTSRTLMPSSSRVEVSPDSKNRRANLRKSTDACCCWARKALPAALTAHHRSAAASGAPPTRPWPLDCRNASGRRRSVSNTEAVLLSWEDLRPAAVSSPMMSVSPASRPRIATSRRSPQKKNFGVSSERPAPKRNGFVAFGTKST